ncbi:hypothetical protein B0H17DRAFT_1218468 [Mycena rosella]|uniref:Uncharacterized protein n=1 Tax=Mycena rosella TaxID=1033263 RepID=A0AAD7FMA8_MYCRO|nr:hypothetical protein B0H17DRAFT_1218468 [Mycena rosella]
MDDPPCGTPPGSPPAHYSVPPGSPPPAPPPEEPVQPEIGTNLAYDEDLAMDTEDPPDEAADEVVHRKATEEDPARGNYHKALRSRIGECFSRGCWTMAPPRPERSWIVHFYSRKFYETRVKARYEERRAALEHRVVHTGEIVPKPLALQNIRESGNFL